jgi:predicted acylesterase/phospholipase RssA
MKKIPKIKKLILSGGGIKGIAIASALETLDDKIQLFSTVREIIGSSIGAYIAFFICIGVSLRKIRVIFENIRLDQFQEFDMKMFISKFGFDEGNKMMNFVKAIIQTQGVDPNITFRQLKKISKYRLIITASNISQSAPKYFSAKETPDFSILTALRISGGYPFAFTPVEIDGELYSDGAIISPIATNVITKKDRKRTLAILCSRPTSQNNIESIYQYILNVIYCIVDSLTEQLAKQLKHKVIIQSTIPSMKFNINEEECVLLEKTGEDSAKEWLSNYQLSERNVSIASAVLGPS